MIEVEMINNQQLKIALNDYLLEELARLPSVSDLADHHAFSAAFERKMRHLRKKAVRNRDNRMWDYDLAPSASSVRRISARRKRLLIAAIILALLLSLMGFTVAREAVFKFIVQVQEKFSTIVFKSDSTDDRAPSITEDIPNMLPSVLPDGYAFSKLNITSAMILATYTNSAGYSIYVEKISLTSSQMNVDTEGAQLETVMVHQTPALYFMNKGNSFLIWQEKYFAYCIIGKISKDEILAMAKSMNK